MNDNARLLLFAATLSLIAARLGVVPTLCAEPNLAAQVDELFAEFNQPESAGCAVGIVRNGESIY